MITINCSSHTFKTKSKNQKITITRHKIKNKYLAMVVLNINFHKNLFLVIPHPIKTSTSQTG
jgi:hypothetical protein